MSEIEKELYDSIVSLPIEKKAELADLLQERVDRETGTGMVYDHILQTVKPEFISLDDFRKIAEERNLKEALELLNKQSSTLTGLYNSSVDKIVVPPRNHDLEFQQMFYLRETRKAVLAHEALHKVQFDNSPLTEMFCFLESKGYSGQVWGKLSRADADEFAARFLKGADHGDVYFYLRSIVPSIVNRQVLHEMAARLLTPKLVGRRLTFPASLVCEGGYGFDLQHMSVLGPAISSVFGYFRSRGHNLGIDIEVNRFIGMHDSSIDGFFKAVDELTRDDRNRYGKAGPVFLETRSDKLDAIPGIVRRVMADYFK